MPMSKMGKVLRDVLEKTFERLPFDPQDGSIYNEGPMMMMRRGGTCKCGPRRSPSAHLGAIINHVDMADGGGCLPNVHITT